jgi:transcription antitermination factor NusG
MEPMNIDSDRLGAGMQAEWLAPKWCVLFVRSNQEKRVAQHLSSRAIEHFLPAYESVRQWRDRKVKLLSPLFPGYVFVRLPLVDRPKALLVPNVVNLVGTRNVPAVISDEEIEWIRRGMAHGKAEPHPYLKAGDAVMIKAGPMAGMEGILIRMQNSIRVLIQLNSISRAFAVEVDSNWVELAPPKTVLRPAC